MDQHSQAFSTIQSDRIENEIEKLRIENNLNNESKPIRKKSLIKSNTIASSYNSSNLELAASSQEASDQFNKKIDYIEECSSIILNATKNMGTYVQDISKCLENYQSDILTDESVNVNKPVVEAGAEVKKENVSVYDLSEESSMQKENNLVVFSTSSTSSMQNLVLKNQAEDETSSIESKFNSKLDDENDYMSNSGFSDELRQDLK